MLAFYLNLNHGKTTHMLWNNIRISIGVATVLALLVFCSIIGQGFLENGIAVFDWNILFVVFVLCDGIWAAIAFVSFVGFTVESFLSPMFDRAIRDAARRASQT